VTLPVFLSDAVTGVAPGSALVLDGDEGRHAATITIRSPSAGFRLRTPRIVPSMHELHPLIWLVRMCVSSRTSAGMPPLYTAASSFWIPSSASGITAVGLLIRGSITTGASATAACDVCVTVFSCHIG